MRNQASSRRPSTKLTSSPWSSAAERPEMRQRSKRTRRSFGAPRVTPESSQSDEKDVLEDQPVEGRPGQLHPLDPAADQA